MKYSILNKSSEVGNNLDRFLFSTVIILVKEKCKECELRKKKTCQILGVNSEGLD